MHVRHLSVADFRSYESAELPLSPGVSTLVGLNGQGKTNLVEAIGYVATLSSHRVAQDQPLVRFGAERAIVRAAVVREGREQVVELEITPGRANRAKLGRAPVPRPRDVLGTLRTVLFAPEDLALVKGDPEQRRRFLDDLLVQRQPRWAGVRADYDKIVRQRSALLKQAGATMREGRGRGRRATRLPEGLEPDAAREDALRTLDIWDDNLATLGSQLLYARLRLLTDLVPHLADTYGAVSASSTDATARYRSSIPGPAGEALAEGFGSGEDVPAPDVLRGELLTAMGALRDQEIDRGVSLVGPHRDDVTLALGPMPAKGYASHGESWSFALGLRLAAYRLLQHDLQDDPVLILDDVFAELDSGRRDRLAGLIGDCEQVIITAAVGEDVPSGLAGERFTVTTGQVSRESGEGVPAARAEAVADE